MKFLITLFLTCFYLTTFSQDKSLALQKSYKPNADEINLKWGKISSGLHSSFVSSNERYSNVLPPDVTLNKEWAEKAWRGEKVHTQILVWSKNNINTIDLSLSNLVGDKGVIKKENIKAGFIDFVITDEFKNGCGYRKATDFDSSNVADIITNSISKQITAKTTNPIWLSIKIPANAKPGIYNGTIQIKGNQIINLPYTIEVIDKVLPPAQDWKYDLDLWQHPQAIARVHNVKLWSKEHFSLMKPYYEMLANAGQKTITASIVDEPWGHQTYDDYSSLVKWIKRKNGTWYYDYSLFDKYIAFVMDCGIQQRINCYSMVPWKIAFKYFDENSDKEITFKEAIGTPAYNDFWKTMLVDFTKHLKQKGWFDKTYIAMDERPMKDMKSVISLLKSIDKDWKIALAGEYHEEIEQDIDVYCIASKWQFPDEVLRKRHQQGKISTWYTCCTEPYPNSFSFSSPAENVWTGWYTAHKNMDGFLRWAYNSWTKHPLEDTRFTAWPAGDTYQIYPGPLSSIRFEKMLEGGQDFEKIQYLKSHYLERNELNKLKELNDALHQFEINSLSKITADEMLKNVKNLLN